MGTGRKIAVGFLAGLLFFVITIGSLLASLSTVITNPNQLKEVLGRDEVYNAVTTAVLEQPFQSTGNPTAAQVETPDVNQESLKKLINQYLTRDWYKGALSTAADGVYAWLEGKTVVPEFVIPVTTDKAGFQQFIIETVASQYNALPVCMGQEATATEINPLDASCKQAGFTSADVATYIRTNAQDEQFDQLFNNASVNSKEIFGEVTPSTTESSQSAYKLLKRMPLLFMLGTLALIGLLFLTVFNRKRAFKVVGVAILVPTAFVLIGALIGWVAKRNIADSATPISSEGSDAMSKVVGEVIGAFIGKANSQALLYGGVLLVLGIVSLLVHHWLGRTLTTAAKPAVEGQVQK